MNWISRASDLVTAISEVSADQRTRCLAAEAVLLKLVQANIGESNKQIVRVVLLQVWEARTHCEGDCESDSHVCLHTIARRLESLITFERNVLELSRSPKFRSYEAAEESLLHDQEELCIA